MWEINKYIIFKKGLPMNAILFKLILDEITKGLYVAYFILII